MPRSCLARCCNGSGRVCAFSLRALHVCNAAPGRPDPQVGSRGSRGSRSAAATVRICGRTACAVVYDSAARFTTSITRQYVGAVASQCPRTLRRRRLRNTRADEPAPHRRSSRRARAAVRRALSGERCGASYGSHIAGAAPPRERHGTISADAGRRIPCTSVT